MSWANFVATKCPAQIFMRRNVRNRSDQPQSTNHELQILYKRKKITGIESTTKYVSISTHHLMALASDVAPVLQSIKKI